MSSSGSPGSLVGRFVTMAYEQVDAVAGDGSSGKWWRWNEALSDFAFRILSEALRWEEDLASGRIRNPDAYVRGALIHGVAGVRRRDVQETRRCLLESTLADGDSGRGIDEVAAAADESDPSRELEEAEELQVLRQVFQTELAGFDDAEAIGEALYRVYVLEMSVEDAVLGLTSPATFRRRVRDLSARCDAALRRLRGSG